MQSGMYHAKRFFATLAGLGVMAALTAYVVLTLGVDDATTYKVIGIAAGVAIASMLSGSFTGWGKALYLIGLISAEGYNCYLVYQANAHHAAEARAAIVESNARALGEYHAAKDAHEAAKRNVEIAEAAVKAADEAVMTKTAERYCKKDCIEAQKGNSTKAQAKLDAARAELKNNPAPAFEPALVDPDAGKADKQIDVFFQIVGAAAGNLIAALLLAGHMKADPAAPKAAKEEKMVPVIRVATPEEEAARKIAELGSRTPRVVYDPAPVDPKPTKRGRKRDPKIVDFAVEFSKRSGRAPTGSEIRAQFPEMPTSTAYSYAKAIAV